MCVSMCVLLSADEGIFVIGFSYPVVPNGMSLTDVFISQQVIQYLMSLERDQGPASLPRTCVSRARPRTCVTRARTKDLRL